MARAHEGSGQLQRQPTLRQAACASESRPARRLCRRSQAARSAAALPRRSASASAAFKAASSGDSDR
eukprot:2505911-Lingulodinium_polyedra.AAC.1